MLHTEEGMEISFSKSVANKSQSTHRPKISNNPLSMSVSGDFSQSSLAEEDGFTLLEDPRVNNNKIYIYIPTG